MRVSFHLKFCPENGSSTIPELPIDIRHSVARIIAQYPLTVCGEHAEVHNERKRSLSVLLQRIVRFGEKDDASVSAVFQHGAGMRAIV